MLTEHLTVQRTLPAMEEELQAQLEKRAHKVLRKQQATAETATNKAAEMAEMEKALQTDAMLKKTADTSRNMALAVGSTEEEAHASGATSLAMARAEHQAPMQT